MPEYLVWFARSNSYYNFRFAELAAVCDLACAQAGLPWALLPEPGCSTPPTALSDKPYARVRLPSAEIAARVAARSVLIRVILEVIGEGETHDAAIAAVDKRRLNATVAGQASFAWRIGAFGKKHSVQEKETLYALYGGILPAELTVDLKSPDIALWV